MTQAFPVDPVPAPVRDPVREARAVHVPHRGVVQLGQDLGLAQEAIESTRAITSPIAIVGGPAGIVSPGANISDVGSSGVIATIMSPKKPFGATRAVVPFGTSYAL